MVRLGLISDSHGSDFWTERFIELANRARYDAVFHMGDGEGAVKWIKKKLNMPLFAVAGNCDMFSKLPGEIVEKYEECRILAVHGHKFDVKWGLEPLSYSAEERGCNIVLYGHTHVPAAEYCGPVLMVNPGALMRGCYGELVIDGNRATPYLKDMSDQ